MKAIFKGNGFVIQWSVRDALTSLPFDFSGMFVDVVLYSNDYQWLVPGITVSSDKLQAEIPSDSLPPGVYNFECTYRRNNGNRGRCIVRNAFQITRIREPEGTDNIVSVESFAAPLRMENTDIGYIGIFAEEGVLPDRESPSWALVGDIKEARPFFYYVPDAVPPGCSAGWNDLSSALGTYDLTEDKVSVYDFSLVTEYNVSNNHSHDARSFSDAWVGVSYSSGFPLYVNGKVYKVGDVVNMDGYDDYSFSANRDVQGIAPFVDGDTNAFTFFEAVRITPDRFRIPGMRITFVNREDGKTDTWLFTGKDSSLWMDFTQWMEIDYKRLADNANNAAKNAIMAIESIERLGAELYDKELVRANAENKRENAENARAEAENARETAESDREKAENARKANETARNSDFDAIRENAEADSAASREQTGKCKEATEEAVDVCSHPNKMGENGNWMVWDILSKEYVDSGIPARGGILFPTVEEDECDLVIKDCDIEGCIIQDEADFVVTF